MASENNPRKGKSIFRTSIHVSISLFLICCALQLMAQYAGPALDRQNRTNRRNESDTARALTARKEQLGDRTMKTNINAQIRSGLMTAIFLTSAAGAQTKN